MTQSKLGVDREAAAVLQLADTIPAAGEVDARHFHGSYLLYRKAGNGMRRLDKTDRGGGTPRFRHASKDGALNEAERLLALYPQSTFIILQEVGRVKLKGGVDG